ncbi:hypothetical protein [Pseudocnuella soli]|uniref:hypothetical protein n=1 Tax=Pseudocnuella soli TaxID=2502779 RepID=UPI00104D5FB2|nr:hypothetical protein [Pseudocnuella soli]
MALAFVDQIAGEAIINDYESWKSKVYENTGMEFGDSYGDVTGRLLYDIETDSQTSRTSSFKYQGSELKLTKKENRFTGTTEYRLRIKANPSAIYFGGNNYRNIPFAAFKALLSDFATSLHLDLNKIRITAPFEPSITVALQPLDFIISEQKLKGRLVIYQGSEHKEMNNWQDKFMGYRANNAHYCTKTYLPSVKFSDPSLNYLRVELKYNRINTFCKRTKIYTWADLLRGESMYHCYQLVLKAWDDTIIHDPALRRSKYYSTYLNQMIRKGSKADFWLNEFPLTASDKTRKERIQEYRELSFSRGEGLHTTVRNWMIQEGEKFRDVTTWLTCNNSELNNQEVNINNSFNITNNMKAHNEKQINSEQITDTITVTKEIVPQALIRMVMKKAKAIEVENVKSR